MGRLKIVYPICCGMDVHRDFVIACIATTNAQGVTEYQSRKFSTYSEELRMLKTWLADNNCKDVCMESTGKYWFPIHNILEDTCNVVVFTNVFGKSASAITTQLLEHPGESFDVTPFVHGRCRTPVDKIQKAVDGVFSYEQAEKLKIIRSHMDSLDRQKAELESLILGIAEKYTSQIDLLMTVPGINDVFTAIRIIAEIGVDMSVFETSKKLCSWAGLTPQNNESAGKKKTTRIGKSGAYLKPLLIQIAIASSRSEKYPEIREKYLTLKKRRGGQKAKVAIARKLLTAIFNILAKSEPYNPTLYHKDEKPPSSRVISQEQAISILANMGYVLDPLVLSTP